MLQDLNAISRWARALHQPLDDGAAAVGQGHHQQRHQQVEPAAYHQQQSRHGGHCLITAAGPLSAGRQAATLLLRHQPSATTAEVYRATYIVVRAPMALPMQVDGGVEKAKEQPTVEGVTYEFSVRPRGLTVLVPRAYDSALFHDAQLTTRWPLRIVLGAMPAMPWDRIEQLSPVAVCCASSPSA